MKNLFLIIILLYLASCNKGIKKPQDPSQFLLLHEKSLLQSDISTQIESEFRMVKGYACSVAIPGVVLPLFLEPHDDKGETLFKFHLAVNSEAHKAILAQLDFSKMIESDKDSELLKGLGFSERQIRKIDKKNAESVEVATTIFFDENELSGRMVRNSVTKDANGKVIKKSSQEIGPLNDCQDSEMEVEVEAKR